MALVTSPPLDGGGRDLNQLHSIFLIGTFGLAKNFGMQQVGWREEGGIEPWPWCSLWREDIPPNSMTFWSLIMKGQAGWGCHMGALNCGVGILTHCEESRPYLIRIPYYNHQKATHWTVMWNDRSPAFLITDIGIGGFHPSMSLAPSRSKLPAAKTVC